MLTEAIRGIFRTNLGVKQRERVLVFTDRISAGELLDTAEEGRRERLRDIALLTAGVGSAFTKSIIFHEYSSVMGHGAEPPRALWQAAFGDKTVKELERSRLFKPLLAKELGEEGIRKVEAIVGKYSASAADAVIALSNYSTSHTRFRDLLTRVCGSRYASMPLFDASMLEGAMNVDWKELAKRTVNIARAVNRAELIEITTPNGTHIKLSKKGRKALPDTGIITRPGAFGNLPAGEAYLAPVEGSANGVLVLEWAPTRELKSPIRLTVRDGLVVGIDGSEPYKKTLQLKLEERKENANVAELGIGTNNKATRPDNILESEKILGTIHIALGDNSSFGGKVKTPFHQDFVFFKPTIIFTHKDGTKTSLMKDGRLV